jgi:hypothetical protein
MTTAFNETIAFFGRHLGRLRLLSRFVAAMEMVSPPLDTEDRQENRSAGDLSDNSGQECAANERGNDRD